jgi:hypothetical protein
MHVSILSGRVAEENWRLLEKSFEHAVKHIPEGIITTLLIQCHGEPKLWQIITIWDTIEIYKKAKNLKITDTCVDLFCNAGTTPYRNDFKVLGKYTRV